MENEQLPLISNVASIQNQGIVRENINIALITNLDQLQVIILVRMLVSLLKLTMSVLSLSLESSFPDAPLRIFVYGTIILDSFYLLFQISKLPCLRASQDQYRLGILNLVTILYVLWLIPGNIWYWKCENCIDKAPIVSVVSLVHLLFGYFYLIGPALFLVCFCA